MLPRLHQIRHEKDVEPAAAVRGVHSLQTRSTFDLEPGLVAWCSPTSGKSECWRPLLPEGWQGGVPQLRGRTHRQCRRRPGPLGRIRHCGYRWESRDYLLSLPHPYIFSSISPQDCMGKFSSWPSCSFILQIYIPTSHSTTEWLTNASPSVGGKGIPAMLLRHQTPCRQRSNVRNPQQGLNFVIPVLVLNKLSGRHNHR